MKPSSLPLPAWLRAFCLVSLLTGFAIAGPAAESDVLVAPQPMQVVAEGAGVHSQLVVAQEIVSPEGGGDLIYTITVEPAHGRVGLAGGEDADFFKNKTGRSGYFAYRADEDYAGEDSFTYTVRNETSGLVYQNRVVLDVKP